MAEDFFKVMASTSEKPLKEKVEALSDIIEKIMTVVLKIPEMVDASLGSLSAQLNTLSSRVGGLEGQISQLRASGVSAAPGTGTLPSGVPPPPPPPPGSRPPPPPQQAPANPQSLRGSIMDELKSLFSKRKAGDDEGQ